MPFHMLGACEQRRSAALGIRIRPGKFRLVEHHGDALGAARRAAYAGTRRCPVDDEIRRTARIGERQGSGDLGDQKGRIVRLRDGEKIVRLEQEWGLRLENLDGRVGATNLDAERKAAECPRSAAVDTPGSGLASAPVGEGSFGLRFRVVPEPRPQKGDEREHRGRQDDAPRALAVRFGLVDVLGHKRLPCGCTGVPGLLGERNTGHVSTLACRFPPPWTPHSRTPTTISGYLATARSCGGPDSLSPSECRRDWSDCIAPCASIRSFTAARRKSPGLSSVSIAAACAAGRRIESPAGNAWIRSPICARASRSRKSTARRSAR